MSEIQRLMANKKNFQLAVSAFESGDTKTAESILRELLTEDPNNPEISHHLGLLMQKQGKMIEAIQFFYIALDKNPSDLRYWKNYIEAMISVGEVEAAKEILELGKQFGLDANTVKEFATKLKAYSNSEQGVQDNLEILLDQLTTFFNREEWDKAESCSISITNDHPENAYAWKIMGLVYDKKGNYSDAENALNKSIILLPDEFESHFKLGLVYMKSEKFEEAILKFKKSIEIHPNHAEAYNNLGNAQKCIGELEDAITSYSHALELKPEIAEIHFNLGTLLQNKEQIEHAILCFNNAIKIRPSFLEAHYNLGGAYRASGALGLAIECYQKVIELDSNNADAFYNLGIVLKEFGEPDKALTHFKAAIRIKPDFVNAYNYLGIVLHDLGLPFEAAENYNKAIEIEPNVPMLYNNMGLALHNVADAYEVIDWYRKAIALDPKFVDAYNNMGLALYQLGQVEESIKYFRHAIELDPALIEAYNNLGNAVRDMGYLDQAIEYYIKAIEINPDSAMSITNLLFCINYHPDLNEEQVYKFYEEYEARFGAPLSNSWTQHSNYRDKDRRLKVGYVSPSFCYHSCNYFMEPLLANHDKQVVEVFAYAEINKSDSATTRYKDYVDHWIPTKGMTDLKLAERIRNDGIDILIDLAGHTMGNHLRAFAYKPAPVSLHWLDFGYTTGLKAIDYYLTDAISAPIGSENIFSETPWRLPIAPYAYRPADGMGEVNTLPALSNGYVTFGTLTRSVRINYRVIRTWGKLLKAVPNSHLVINSSNFADSKMQELMANEFLAMGISRERIEIGYQTPAWDVLRGIDIGLDCFPHNSGTTLFETLYMGIPFVTISGRPPMGRMGASVLSAINHKEWIANSEEEYIAIATSLAHDLTNLSKLRCTLRKEMQGSQLMDEVGFARAVEAAYREMWLRWCDADHSGIRENIEVKTVISESIEN